MPRTQSLASFWRMVFETPGTFNSFTLWLSFSDGFTAACCLAEEWKESHGAQDVELSITKASIITTNLGSAPKLHPPLINWLLISPFIPSLHQGEGTLKQWLLPCCFWLKWPFVAPPMSTFTLYFLLTLACPCSFIFKFFCKAVSGSQQSQTVHRDFPCIPSPDTVSLKTSVVKMSEHAFACPCHAKARLHQPSLMKFACIIAFIHNWANIIVWLL